MLGGAYVVEDKAITLDKIYFCAHCNKLFLFESDVAYHRDSSDHQDFATIPLWTGVREINQDAKR